MLHNEKRVAGNKGGGVVATVPKFVKEKGGAIFKIMTFAIQL